VSFLRPTHVSTFCVAAIALVGLGCGSDEKGSGRESETNHNSRIDTKRGRAPATPPKSVSNERQGHVRGDPRTTYTSGGSAKGIVRVPSSRRGKLALLRRAKQEPGNADAGCRRVRIVGVPPTWGPPPPSISAKLSGGRALVAWRYRSLPKSLACKPFQLVVAVSTGEPRTPTFRSSVRDYPLRGLRGRANHPLQFAGNPPFTVTVTAETVTGKSGPSALVRLDR
jgi:hypothetical protein